MNSRQRIAAALARSDRAVRLALLRERIAAALYTLGGAAVIVATFIHYTGN